MLNICYNTLTVYGSSEIISELIENTKNHICLFSNFFPPAENASKDWYKNMGE